MKKILASVLCLALAGSAVLSSCGGSEETKEVNKTEENVEEVVGEVVEIEVPEAQLDYEFEINTLNKTAKITNYLGEEAEVVIPDTITDPVYGDVVPVESIGSYSFAENEFIEVVKIPETVTEIEKGAFQSCPNLRAVSLPAGLTAIKDNAFYNSNKIDKLGIFNGTLPTEENPVALYDGISNEFPATVEEIGFMAFSSQLNEIPWYSALTDEKVILGDGILLKFKGTEGFVMDESIKHVAYYAFTNAGPMKITLENQDVEFHMNSVFMCDKEFTFLIPDGNADLAGTVKSLGAAYEYIIPEEQLNYELTIDAANGVATVDKYIGTEAEVDIPDLVIDPARGGKHKVTKIGTDAFANCETVEAVLVPETVTVIADGAFQSCPNLRAVSLPAGLTEIGQKAFYNSAKVEKLGMLVVNEPVAEEPAETTEVEAVEESAETTEVEAVEEAAETTEVEAVEEPAETTEVEAVEEAAETTEVEATEEATETVEEVVEVEEVIVPVYDQIGNMMPSTLKKIGPMAFITEDGVIAWFAALDETAVIVGEGLLIKFNETEGYVIDDSVKTVTYGAFRNIGAVTVNVANTTVKFEANSIVGCDEGFKFIIPEGDTALGSAITKAGGAYEFLAPEVEETTEETEAAEETVEAADAEATEETAEAADAEATEETAEAADAEATEETAEAADAETTEEAAA